MEIQCKDNTKILTLATNEELTKGLQTIAKEHLNIGVNEKEEIVCSFGEAITSPSVNLLKVSLYIVGDLAFYGMILGTEGISGNYYHLCKLAVK